MTENAGLYKFGSHLVVELARIGDSNKASETPLRYTQLYTIIISQPQNPVTRRDLLICHAGNCGTALYLWDGFMTVGRAYNCGTDFRL